jgi:hypothetical protein
MSANSTTKNNNNKKMMLSINRTIEKQTMLLNPGSSESLALGGVQTYEPHSA